MMLQPTRRHSKRTAIVPCLLSLLLSSIPIVDAGTRSARWSSTPLGPDGPWNALVVTLGDGQEITTYAGKMWESYFLSSSYCDSVTTKGKTCYAQQAGAIYNDSADTGSAPDIDAPPPDFWSNTLNSTGSGSRHYGDTFHLGVDTTDWAGDVIENLDMALLDDTQLVYPGGQEYPLFTGCLGLGAAPGIMNHSFKVTPGTDEGAVNMSLIAGMYESDGWTSSNTFGMHIGSVQPKPVAGSLMFGGYDKNRALGEVLAVPMSTFGASWTGTLLSDVSITVVEGGSPLDFSSKSGYLASGNSSIGNNLEVNIDPCAPYLNLPQSTCDALAADLPVTYNADLGLYLWDTASSSAYWDIIPAPVALVFSLQDPQNNTRTVNISVPFMHLNLTLTEPLVDTPTAYFPCYAGSNGNYALGRAFLQDALFATNFESSIYFLAQAPGPNVGTVVPTTISSESTTIDSSDNDWVLSWNQVWVARDGDAGGDSGGSGGNSTSPDNGSSSSKNAIIGGVVGGVGGVLILSAIGFFAYRHWKKRDVRSKESQGYSVPEDQNKYLVPGDGAAPQQWARAELGADSGPAQYQGTENRPQEMEHTQYPVELPGSGTAH
ncbi:aspartic peptidase domain-containing protein [Xylariales sp. PMI_506]|nr:aspartic peptidase domain-containing protein [Xylariales sp. PMI_506]